ncbi:MAG: glycosyltransferase [Rhodocyclaceae bacterium]|nr:glycosyltransferase [Rhodocyclaceae bacterium]
MSLTSTTNELTTERLLYSLIVATFGREYEVRDLLRSLAAQNLDSSNFEVIIVDQNDNESLSSIITEFRGSIKNLIHVKSDTKGLSLNRNIGIKMARGEILGFPDDDCRYYPDTLLRVSECFNTNPTINLVAGAIVDRDCGADIIRAWPHSMKPINKFNFFGLYSSITIFTRARIEFDEMLGVGAKYGSYEDADFVARVIKATGPGIYTYGVQVWHPQLNVHTMSIDKISKYGHGFGALCRKHASAFFILLFVASISHHAIEWVRAALKNDSIGCRRRKTSVMSRLDGWTCYSKELSKNMR